MDQSISLIRDEFVKEVLVHDQSLKQEDPDLIACLLLEDLRILYTEGLWS